MRLLLTFLLALTLFEVTFAASVTLSQQKELDSKGDQYPTFFKVYSQDGRESLTASCTPINVKLDAKRVSCNFVNVRIIPPKKRQFKTHFPLTIEETLKKVPELANEYNKNPKEFKQKWITELKKAKRKFCKPSFKKKIEKKINNPAIGPKRKSYYQKVLAACSVEDPRIYFRRLEDLEHRTCSLFIDNFTLEFKEVDEGQWLYRQESPGLLSNVLKVYELIKDGYIWIFTETRIPTKGSKEKASQTVWKSTYYSEYEIPCDFISHDMIQLPFSGIR